MSIELVAVLALAALVAPVQALMLMQLMTLNRRIGRIEGHLGLNGPVPAKPGQPLDPWAA